MTTTECRNKMIEVVRDTFRYYREDPSRRSLDEDGECAYRGQNGNKCAVGRYIPDDEYRPDMEGGLHRLFYSGLFDPPEGTRNYWFWIDLQKAHDEDFLTEEFENEFIEKINEGRYDSQYTPKK